jgi:hypothetical protein
VTTLGRWLMKSIDTPTEVDHYQLRRVIDVYVSPQVKIWEDWRTVSMR